MSTTESPRVLLRNVEWSGVRSLITGLRYLGADGFGAMSVHTGVPQLLHKLSTKEGQRAFVERSAAYTPEPWCSAIIRYELENHLAPRNPRFARSSRDDLRGHIDRDVSWLQYYWENDGSNMLEGSVLAYLEAHAIFTQAPGEEPPYLPFRACDMKLFVLLIATALLEMAADDPAKADIWHEFADRKMPGGQWARWTMAEVDEMEELRQELESLGFHPTDQ